jgi:hypothetical protein
MIHTAIGDVNLAPLVAGAIFNLLACIVKYLWERGRK